MTRQKLTISLVAAAFAFSLTPVLAAQDTRGGGQAGSRPNTGSTTGSAAPRGGGSSGSSGTTSSSSGGSSSGSSSSSGMGSSSSGSSGYAPARERAPERPSASERRGSGGEQAMPRGTSSATSGNNARGTSGGAATSSTYYGEGRDRTPVPAYSRPRDGRTAIGGAVERTAGIPDRGQGYYPIYDPYYYSGFYNPFYSYGYRYSSYWMPGFGYGFGYFGYDPFLFGGYYDPYYSAYGQSSGGYDTGGYRGAVGSLRLKVKPVNAQVYIDGYYVGVIDSFDGTFQRLEIEAGSHRVEVRAEGFTPVQFDVMVTPGETITYKGQLQPIR
jgi:hypothetical protein